jgi:multisubunit Na+/H+ antiporter MnhG subunit
LSLWSSQPEILTGWDYLSAATAISLHSLIFAGLCGIMKTSFCDFGVLFTALLAALTVVLTAPAESSLATDSFRTVLASVTLRH